MRSGAVLAALALIAPMPAAAQAATDVPSRQELADSSLALGKRLYDGTGNCAWCHGAAGVGTSRGSDLTDDVWRHGDGGYLSIVEQVVHGVGHPTGGPVAPMPKRGMGNLTYPEVRAVAAYVWSLSHAVPRDTAVPAPRRRR
jgi:mono/diheme cytochrome c family protein